MSDSRPKDTPKGSPELWLDAAFEVLLSQGVEAVKIQPLARQLGLSRTSFYWFFKDRTELLTALLDRWEGATTAPLIAATQDYAATQTEAMLNVISTFLSDASFNARFELAVRAWAQQDTGDLARLHDTDTRRLAALRGLLERWGHDPADADVRARTIYLVQVGYISMRVVEPLEVRLARFPSYVEIYTGQRPSEADMARCRARITAQEAKA